MDELLNPRELDSGIRNLWGDRSFVTAQKVGLVCNRKGARVLCYYTDFWTFPLRKHRVQTRMRLVCPLISARTGWRFGLKIRFVLLLA